MEHTMRLYAVAAAKLNVNCNVIIPGVTRTDAWKGLDKSGAILERASQRVPMGEGVIIDPRDIGDAVVFLSKSGGGGRFITGQSIPVDGGLTLARRYKRI